MKSLRSRFRKSRGVGALFFVLLLQLGGFIGGPAAQPAPDSASTDQLIVKYRSDRLEEQLNAVVRTTDIAGRQGVNLTYLHRGALDIHVFKLDRTYSLSELERVAADLKENDPTIEYVEPDFIAQPLYTPNDTRYNEQWHYFESTGGINLPTAWNSATGSGIRVAVIDTGYRPHTDLASNILGGYDFITNIGTANDGNGRDSDAQDPGDNCGGGSPSSWHGTHVAGTVAAVTGNSSGVAGVAFNAKVVPVRVLGCGGGYASDISAGIIWAAGGSVSGVPANSYPADVLNLSLGGAGSCSATYQNAINSALSNDAVVVVAAGNSNADAVNFQPANCSGVITVASTDRSGGRASYSNFGSTVEIAAPGGEIATLSNGVLSTRNTGFSSPGSDSYEFLEGTSMATPHVSGTLALMLSTNGALTASQALAIMRATARNFPATCTGCGAGIVNAAAAVAPSATTTIMSGSLSVPSAHQDMYGCAVYDNPMYFEYQEWCYLKSPYTLVYHADGYAQTSWVKTGYSITGMGWSGDANLTVQTNLYGTP